MTNLITFDGFQDSEIRVTEDGRYSVYDVIKFCGKKNPRDAWNRITERFPELANNVQLHQFKGKGKGQRPTPVASLDIALWLCAYIKNTGQSVDLCPNRILKKGAWISEQVFREALVQFYKECGESPKTEVPCEVGRADIVTDATVVEVKQVGGWKQALGQAVAYASCLKLFPEVALFGDSRQHDFSTILRYCTQMNVAVSIWDTADGTAFGFILGQGSWSVSNTEELSHRIKVAHQSSLN